MYRGINFAINANFDRYFYKKSYKTEEKKKTSNTLGNGNVCLCILSSCS